MKNNHPSVSVIIPARNELENLNRLLPDLIKMEGVAQILVVDGGSRPDQLAPLPNETRRVFSEPGRALQMNRGAVEATGDVLWFLHADSRPDPKAVAALSTAIRNGAVGGCFSLRFYDADSALLRFIARNSNRRAKWLRLMFGDQGIFVRRDRFEQMGGYAEIPIMEDWDFSVRLHKQGRVSVLPVPIGTSARRFIEGGTLPTLLKMHWLKIRYILGVSPETLAREYRETKR